MYKSGIECDFMCMLANDSLNLCSWYPTVPIQMKKCSIFKQIEQDKYVTATQLINKKGLKH